MHGLVERFKIGNAFIGVYKKNIPTFFCGFEFPYHFFLLKTVNFPQKSFNAVSVNGFFEIFFACRNAYSQTRFTAYLEPVNRPDGKNRNGFPCGKQTVDLFAALQFFCSG